MTPTDEELAELRLHYMTSHEPYRLAASGQLGQASIEAMLQAVRGCAICRVKKGG